MSIFLLSFLIKHDIISAFEEQQKATDVLARKNNYIVIRAIATCPNISNKELKR